MSTGWIVFFCVLGCVAFFVLAFSITLIIKGRFMENEISQNRHMRERGIRCALQQGLEADRLASGRGDDCNPGVCGGDRCADCSGERPSCDGRESRNG